MRNRTGTMLMRYGCAALSIALATCIRLLLDPVLGNQFPYATFFFAVLLTAWYGGFGPALAAVIFGALSSAYFLIPPRGTFAVEGWDQQAGMVLYLTTSLGIALLGGAMRTAQQRAERAKEDQRSQREAAEEAERQVRASEERLRLFVEHTPAAVAMLDQDMRYLLISQRRLSDFGLEGQNVIGRSYYEVFPDVPQRWKEVHRRCLAGAVERCEEDQFIRPDGQELWLRWEICPWRDQQGEIGGVIVFSEVITDRKRAQEALRQQQEWLRVTLASIGDAVITTDTEGRVTFLNPVAETLTGWDQEQAQGQPLEAVFPILHEQTRRPVENPVAKVIREGVIVGLGNHTVLRQGRERTAH